MSFTKPVQRRSPPPELHENAVHVWVAPIPAMPAPELWEVLSQDERDRASRFKFEEYRSRYVRARAVLRQILGSYLETAPAELQFIYPEDGKPSLKQGAAKRLKFNLSHSGDLALIGISNFEVGVDIEFIRPLAEQWQIAQLFFTQSEAEELEKYPEEVRSEAFYRCWTRKEALLKGWGCGITKNLKAFRVSLEEQPQQVLLECIPQLRGAWTIQSLKVHPLYAAAVAADDFEFEVESFSASTVPG